MEQHEVEENEEADNAEGGEGEEGEKGEEGDDDGAEANEEKESEKSKKKKTKASNEDKGEEEQQETQTRGLRNKVRLTLLECMHAIFAHMPSAPTPQGVNRTRALELLRDQRGARLKRKAAASSPQKEKAKRTKKK
ncbi:MAG: hypothetical protein SGPRY_000799 [Prymnesium sp.]